MAGFLHHHLVQPDGCVHPAHVRLVAVGNQPQQQAVSARAGASELGYDQRNTFHTGKDGETYRFSHSLKDKSRAGVRVQASGFSEQSWTPAQVNSRLHVEEVFDPQAFPLPASLLAQPLLGPGHVDALLLTGPSAPVTGCRMGRRVPVVDQLSLRQKEQTKRRIIGRRVRSGGDDSKDESRDRDDDGGGDGEDG